MAVNTEELNKIKEMGSADKFIESIEGKADPFAGYSLEDLQAISGIIAGFNNSKAKEAVMSMIRDEITKKQNTQQPQNGVNEPKTQETQPSAPASQAESDELPDMEFMKTPSYSQYVEFMELLTQNKESKAAGADKKTLDEQQAKLKYILQNSKKVIDLAVGEDITPEKAVFLSDYFAILHSTANFEDYHKDLEEKVNAKLEEFDKENNLEMLKDLAQMEEADAENNPDSPKNIPTYEHMTSVEDSWYVVADIHTANEPTDKETDDIIKHLCVQKLKAQIRNSLYTEVSEICADRHHIPPQDIIEAYASIVEKAQRHEALSDQEKQQVAEFEEIRAELRSKIFAEKYEEVRAEFEAVKMAELAKLSAEEAYPITDDMSEAEKQTTEQKRAEYAAEHLPTDESKWIEEQALKAFRAKYSDKDALSDEDIKSSKEYDAFKSEYTKKAQYVSDSVKTLYTLKIEALASRTACITNSPEINPQTRKFLKDFANNHPNMYGYGKVAMIAGKKAVLTQLISHAAGLNGLAVYSAYNTYKSFQKSYDEYLKAGGEKGFKNFVAYLRKPENRNKRIDLMKQAAISGVAIGAAIASNVAGMGIGGAVAAPLMKRVATTVISGASEIAKAAGAVKDYVKAVKNGDQEGKKASSKAWKKALIGLGVVAGTAVLGWTGIKLFTGDNDENKLSDLDEKLIKNGDGKGLNSEDSDQIAKNINNLSNTNNNDITDPLNQNSDENTTTEPQTAEQNSNDAAEATQAVADQYANFDLYSDPQTVNNINQFVGYPAFSAQKLQELGLIDEKTADELSGYGGTRKTLAKLRELNENATPEEKAKLAEYKEWINDRSARNAEIIKYNNEHGIGQNKHIDEVRNKAKQLLINQQENGNDTGASTDGAVLQQQQSTEYEYSTSQRKKYLGGLFSKSVNPEQVKVNLSEYIPQEQLNQMTPEQMQKASMQIAAGKYIEENNVKRAEITGPNNDRHIYFRDKTNDNGETISKRIDYENNHKTTTEMKQSENASLVKYKGKEETVVYVDQQNNTVNIGGEGKDKVLRTVVDKKEGVQYTLVKGDDGKKYTIATNMQTGQSVVHQGGSKSAMKEIYKNIRDEKGR